MKRASLDALDREALIRLAEEHGITRPRILTRPELVDEILLRSATEPGADASLARGFFGLARDLVARVVERGRCDPLATHSALPCRMEIPMEHWVVWLIAPGRIVPKNRADMPCTTCHGPVLV